MTRAFQRLLFNTRFFLSCRSTSRGSRRSHSAKSVGVFVVDDKNDSDVENGGRYLVTNDNSSIRNNESVIVHSDQGNFEKLEERLQSRASVTNVSNDKFDSYKRDVSPVNIKESFLETKKQDFPNIANKSSNKTSSLSDLENQIETELNESILRSTDHEEEELHHRGLSAASFVSRETDKGSFTENSVASLSKSHKDVYVTEIETSNKRDDVAGKKLEEDVVDVSVEEPLDSDSKVVSATSGSEVINKDENNSMVENYEESHLVKDENLLDKGFNELLKETVLKESLPRDSDEIVDRNKYGGKAPVPVENHSRKNGNSQLLLADKLVSSREEDVRLKKTTPAAAAPVWKPKKIGRKSRWKPPQKSKNVVDQVSELQFEALLALVAFQASQFCTGFV